MLRTMYLRYRLFVRFGVAGLPGSLVFYVLFYGLTEFAGIHYITSTLASFLVGSGVTFLFQKFWAFKDVGLESLKLQMVQYYVSKSLLHLTNTACLYVAVEHLNAWYFGAQIVIALGLFVIGYIVARLIFTDQNEYRVRSPLGK